jgi:hypothetical protein
VNEKAIMSLSLTPLDWTIGIVALIFNLALGLYLAIRGKHERSSDDFFLAGRRLTWPVVGASLLATNIGAEHMVGLCGDAYRYGFSAGVVELRILGGRRRIDNGILPRHRLRFSASILLQEQGFHDPRVRRASL